MKVDRSSVLTFAVVLIGVVWGLRKHQDDERDEKAKKHSQAQQKHEAEKKGEKYKPRSPVHKSECVLEATLLALPLTLI